FVRHADAPGVGCHGPRQNLHQGGFSRAIMADQPDTFPTADGKIDAVKGTGSAIPLFDPRKADTVAASRRHFMLALIAACASAWLYSRLATPPLGIFLRAASKLSCVNARYGTMRSCGIFLLPSRTCCATQKARLEMPGAMDADQVR